ncbi:hypothetical protein LOAG_14618, partial [Loa loa]
VLLPTNFHIDDIITNVHYSDYPQQNVIPIYFHQVPAPSSKASVQNAVVQQKDSDNESFSEILNNFDFNKWRNRVLIAKRNRVFFERAYPGLKRACRKEQNM